jgi:hypothetical protein
MLEMLTSAFRQNFDNVSAGEQLIIGVVFSLSNALTARI